MTFDGEYEPSPTPWVRDQVGQIEATGDTATVHHVSGRPIVLMSMRGARSGYAGYQVKTSRSIPLFVLEPRDPDVVQP